MPEQETLPLEQPKAPPVAPIKFVLPDDLPAEGAEKPLAQAPAAEAPATPADEKPAPTPEEAEKRKSQSRFERRIDKLHRRAAEQQARADFFEKQLAELKTSTTKPAAFL
jgi:hypothetical protein